jgi:hypothetical protein
VDEAADTRPGGDVEERPRALDVDPLEGVGGRVVAVERGDVDDDLAAADDALEARRVEQVDALGADVGPALAELPGDVAPDEAGRSADVDVHGARARRTRPSAMTGQTSR